MYYQIQDSSKVWCEPEGYVTKLECPEMKIENESNKFPEGDPDLDVIVKVGRVTKF